MNNDINFARNNKEEIYLSGGNIIGRTAIN